MSHVKILMTGIAIGFFIGWQRKAIVAFAKPYCIKVWSWAKAKVGWK